MSASLWPHGLQHSKLPWPSPSPGICSNSSSLSWWCHPTTSSSVAPFSSCPQSFPASGSFPMSHLFTSGGQSIGVSASSSVLPMNVQGWLAKYKCILWDELCPWNRCIEMLMIIICEWDYFRNEVFADIIKLISWQGKGLIGESNGTPLQYSCLENPMDGGAW